MATSYMEERKKKLNSIRKITLKLKTTNVSELTKTQLKELTKLTAGTIELINSEHESISATIDQGEVIIKDYVELTNTIVSVLKKIDKETDNRLLRFLRQKKGLKP